MMYESLCGRASICIPFVRSRGTRWRDARWDKQVSVVPTWLLGVPSSIDVDKRRDKEFKGGFTGAAAGAETSNRSLRWLASILGGGWAGSLCGVRAGVGPGTRWEVWLGGRPTPLLALCAGGMPRILLLVSAPQKWQKVFSVLFCFVLFPFWAILVALICPNGASMHLFLVPYSFFVFCCSRRCLFRCKHCSQCSQGSQAPDCLRFTQTTPPAAEPSEEVKWTCVHRYINILPNYLAVLLKGRQPSPVSQETPLSSPILAASVSSWRTQGTWVERRVLSLPWAPNWSYGQVMPSGMQMQLVCAACRFHPHPDAPRPHVPCPDLMTRNMVPAGRCQLLPLGIMKGYNSGMAEQKERPVYYCVQFTSIRGHKRTVIILLCEKLLH